YPDDPQLLSAREGTLSPVQDLVGNPIEWQPGTDTAEKLMDKQSTLLPVHWLEVGVQRARPIAKVKRADSTFGTGFLIKGNLFLTNNHVLPTPEIASAATFQFNYQKN